MEKMMGCNGVVTSTKARLLVDDRSAPDAAPRQSLRWRSTKATPLSEKDRPISARCCPSRFRKVLILGRTQPDAGRAPSSACIWVTYTQLVRRGRRARAPRRRGLWSTLGVMPVRHVSRVRALYRRILLLHRVLPPDLKALGDQYVKDEFRRHKTVGSDEAERFLQEWEASNCPLFFAPDL